MNDSELTNKLDKLKQDYEVLSKRIELSKEGLTDSNLKESLRLSDEISRFEHTLESRGRYNDGDWSGHKSKSGLRSLNKGGNRPRMEQ